LKAYGENSGTAGELYSAEGAKVFNDKGNVGNNKKSLQTGENKENADINKRKIGGGGKKKIAEREH